MTDGDSTDPAETARRFLDALAARDLPAARAYLAPGFTMQFPGSEPMTALEDLIAWSRPRYRRIGKRIDGIDACGPTDARIVYVHGTLHGEWSDGRAFDGIRFVDRFAFERHLIHRQDVWNDLAEHRG